MSPRLIRRISTSQTPSTLQPQLFRPRLRRRTGDNFINILRARFLYENSFRSFPLALAKVHMKAFCTKKCAHTMKMKLTKGDNFINISQAAFTPTYP